MTDQRRSPACPPLRLRALLALLVGALALSTAPPSAADEFSWAVSPASDGAPDERSWIELELDPGSVASEEAAVTNLSNQTVTFRIDAADGYFTDQGRFNMLPSDQESVDAGTWIAAPETVTVEPGGIGIVPFTVTVPDNAEPGDHAAGIAASLVSVGADAGGSSIGVESRIGFRVMTRVSGDVAPSVAVEDIATDYRLSWNPFAPGSLSVDAEIVNTGNVRLLLDGTVSAQGASVPLLTEDAAAQEMLPGDRRTITVALDGVWPLFAVNTDVTVTPIVATPDGVEPVPIAPVTASATVLAVPLPQLLMMLGIALISAALLAGRSRSRRRLTQLLREAREEGLREGVSTGR